MQATSCLLLLPSPKSQNENERLCTVWPSTINQRGSVFLLLLLLSWLAKDGSRLARQSLISLTPEILSGCIADKLVQRNLQYSATQHNRYHFILVAIPKYISMQRCRNTNTVYTTQAKYKILQKWVLQTNWSTLPLAQSHPVWPLGSLCPLFYALPNRVFKQRLADINIPVHEIYTACI